MCASVLLEPVESRTRSAAPLVVPVEVLIQAATRVGTRQRSRPSKVATCSKRTHSSWRAPGTAGYARRACRRSTKAAQRITHPRISATSVLRKSRSAGQCARTNVRQVIDRCGLGGIRVASECARLWSGQRDIRVLHGPLDARVAPGRVLRSHTHDQRPDVGVHSGPSRRRPAYVR